MKHIRCLFIFVFSVFVYNATFAMKSHPADKCLVNLTRVSINLMWINRVANKTQPYIHKACTESELKQDFLDNIFKWAEIFPCSQINVWYDGELVSESAVTKTNQLIESMSLKLACSSKIQLRNIREISMVNKNADVFSDRVVVYFRVDLLRPIIALYMLNDTRETDYFVYADLDMEIRPTPDVLFSDYNMCNIKQYGILMAKLPVEPGEEAGSVNTLNYENSFQVISNHNKNLIEAIQFVLIDSNITKARNALTGKFTCDSRTTPMKQLTEAVYFGYQDMIKYWNFLEGNGKLYVTKHTIITTLQHIKTMPGKKDILIPKKTKIQYSIQGEYSKEMYGLEPFNLNNTKEFGLIFIPSNHRDIKGMLSMSNESSKLIEEYLKELVDLPIMENVIVRRSNISAYNDPLYIIH